MARVMSRFSRVRSEDDRLESLADPSSMGDVDENDPRSVARFMKKMGEEFGDELGDDFEGAVDEAVAESPAEDKGDSTSDDAGDL
jgi:hypothetical protein